jgi:5-methylthioadenosine/S-adenosylhomocysteine deaminase
MLLSGITTASDMSCHRNLGSLASLGAADGLAGLGMRGVVSFGAEDRYDGAPPPAVFMTEHEALADRVAGEPLLSFRAGVGTVLWISEDLLARTVAACGEHGWAVHTPSPRYGRSWSGRACATATARSSTRCRPAC